MLLAMFCYYLLVLFIGYLLNFRNNHRDKVLSWLKVHGQIKTKNTSSFI